MLATTAVVTGASRGLGLALVQALAESDVQVLLTARHGADASSAAKALAARGLNVQPYAGSLDVQDHASIAEFASFIADEVGDVDLLINNAAICSPGWTRPVVHQSLCTNVLAPLALARALLPAMRRRGRGHVVNISSGDGELLYLNTALQAELRAVRSIGALLRILARTSPPGDAFGTWPAHGPTPAYAVSKGALNALTRLLAAELPPPEQGGVRVSAVCPGDVLTRMCTDTDARSMAVSPADAAVDVRWLAMAGLDEHVGLPSGHFWRARHRIPF